MGASLKLALSSSSTRSSESNWQWTLSTLHPESDNITIMPWGFQCQGKGDMGDGIQKFQALGQAGCFQVSLAAET